MSIRNNMSEIQDYLINTYNEEDYKFYEVNEVVTKIIDEFDDISDSYNIQSKALFPGYTNELCFALYHKEECLEFCVFSEDSINFIKEIDSEVVETMDNINKDKAKEIIHEWGSSLIID